MVRGAPGVGKTKVAVCTALEMVKQNPDARVLCVAVKNPAVDNLLESFCSLRHGDSQPDVFRFNHCGPSISGTVARHTSSQICPELQKQYERAKEFVIKQSGDELPTADTRDALLQSSEAMQNALKQMKMQGLNRNVVWFIKHIILCGQVSNSGIFWDFVFNCASYRTTTSVLGVKD